MHSSAIPEGNNPAGDGVPAKRKANPDGKGGLAKRAGDASRARASAGTSACASASAGASSSASTSAGASSSASASASASAGASSSASTSAGASSSASASASVLTTCWTLHTVRQCWGKGSPERTLVLDRGHPAFQPDQPLAHLGDINHGAISLTDFEVAWSDRWCCNASFKKWFDNVVYFGGSDSIVGFPYTPGKRVVEDADYSSIGAAVSAMRAAFEAYCPTYPVLKYMHLPVDPEESKDEDGESDSKQPFLMKAFILAFVMTNGTTCEVYIAAALQLLLDCGRRSTTWFDQRVAKEVGVFRMSKVCAAAAKLLMEWGRISKLCKTASDVHPASAETLKLLGDWAELQAACDTVHDEAGGSAAVDKQGARDALKNFKFVVKPAPPEASAAEVQFARAAENRLQAAFDAEEDAW